jgi:hypothetical protein
MPRPLLLLLLLLNDVPSAVRSNPGINIMSTVDPVNNVEGLTSANVKIPKHIAKEIGRPLLSGTELTEIKSVTNIDYGVLGLGEPKAHTVETNS